jgi:hypothetical protein
LSDFQVYRRYKEDVVSLYWGLDSIAAEQGKSKSMQNDPACCGFATLLKPGYFSNIEQTYDICNA